MQTLLQLLHTTNDGRLIFADAKINNGHLSDESQNTLTKLIINHLFQEKNKYVYLCISIYFSLSLPIVTLLLNLKTKLARYLLK